MSSSHKNLIIAYLAGHRSLIGCLDSRVSDQHATVIKAVGELIDEAVVVPGQGAMKQSFIIGLALNMGPVNEVTINTITMTHTVEVNEKNLGPAAFERVCQAYDKFMGYSMQDRVSKVVVPTTQETVDVTGRSAGKLRLQ